MAYRKKIISAGPLVKEAIYPYRSCKGAASTVRRRTGGRTCEAQRRMNALYSWQKLELLLAANFVKGDVVGCLTFDDAHLPETRAQVRNRWRYFLSKLTAARKKRGAETVAFWAIENVHGEGRWHIHFVYNAVGDDYAEISRLWGQGSCEFSALRCDKIKNYESLARYMAKEARDKVGQRAWSYTRNARKPEVETFAVASFTPLRLPRGATMFEDARSATGEWQYIKYAYDDALKVRRRKPRRRKRNV